MASILEWTLKGKVDKTISRLESFGVMIFVRPHLSLLSFYLQISRKMVYLSLQGFLMGSCPSSLFRETAGPPPRRFPLEILFQRNDHNHG
jgi:hypothetical protein